jgi:hypothetical protein
MAQRDREAGEKALRRVARFPAKKGETVKTNIVQLSSGYEVEVRAVPPTAYLDVELDWARTHPTPDKPKVDIKSVAGHVEQVVSAMDSPEYAEWQRANDLRELELRQVKINFAYNYSVIRWRKDAETWETQPPMDWERDPLIPDTGAPKRVQFIKFELIASIEDDRAISNPFPVKPLLDEEVEAALAKFRLDEERATAPASARKRKGHKR